MKQILLATLCVLAVLTSCKESKNNQGGVITFKRADISGAKFLTLAGGSDNKASTETNTVYKIDENGNMTVVAFYLEIDQDGNKSIENVSEDIKVVPRSIEDYGKGYMLFVSCEVRPTTDKYQNFVSHLWYRPSFLVRKSDGAIFELDKGQLNYFPVRDVSNPDENFITNLQIAYNSRGELYMRDDFPAGVYKLTLENEKLFLQQITTGVSVASILIDKNDNLYANVSSLSEGQNLLPLGGYMYLANGSVVAVPVIDSYYDKYLFLIDNEYYSIVRSSEGEYYNPIYTYTLRKISSFTPNISFSEIATLTATNTTFFQFENCNVIDAGNKALFCNKYRASSYVVYDKLTQQLSRVPLSDGFEKVSFNQQGIAYEYSAQNCTQITRYNIVNMTKKTVDCDRSAVPPFIQTTTKVISTDFFEFGIKNSNGAPIRVQTNLESGKVTVHEDADDRIITELIRVS